MNKNSLVLARSRTSLLALFGSVACITASAAESAGTAASQEAPHRFETTHQGTFGGTRLRYQAIVEEHFIKDDAGQRTASVYTISYLRSDAKADAAQRPVIFAFNGGPGSSSVWLHLGLLGPARVEAGEPSKPNTVAPFRYVENPDSPLDVADIVLIDPPGTGYSRILPAGKPEQFLSTDADARMTVDLMRDWLKDHGRLNSPRYIISESYGTIRAAVVAKMLAGGPIVTGRMEGIALNGVILLGQSMDMSNDSSDRPALTALPTLAAAACYHHKVQPGCTAAAQADAARKLARASLLPALYDGYRLDPANRAQLAGQIAELIGVDQQAVLDANLRLSPGDFAQQLLKKDGRRTGMYDARYTLPLAGAGQDPVADDPAMAQYVPAYVGAWSDYSRKELGIDLAVAIRGHRVLRRQLSLGLRRGRRRSQRQELRIGPGDRREPQPGAARDGRRGLLRPRHDHRHGRVHARTLRHPRGPHRVSLLRIGPHALPRRRDAQRGRAGLATIRDGRTTLRASSMRNVPLALLSLLAVAASAPAMSATSATTRYSVLSNGEKVGHLDVQRADRVRDIDYAVSDNGRGPAIKEHMVLDAQGIPVAWTIDGHSLMGGAVHEEMSWKDGVQSWTSQADHGEVRLLRQSSTSAMTRARGHWGCT